MTDDGLYRRAYRFFNMVFAEFYTGQIAYSMMSEFDLYLDALDPEKQGMTITSENGHETYVIGTTTLMERTFTEESETITLTFPETEGYELFITYQSNLTEDGQNIEAQFLLYEDQEERYNVSAVANGLPVEDQIVADGNVTFTFSGNAWRDVPSPISLDFHYDRSQVSLPYDMTFTLDWLHPETQISGFTLQYEASMQDMPSDTLVEQIYDNQNDFFSLNEGFVDEYTERFKTPIALSLLPFVLEMPSGVIDDLFVFLDSTSILAILGLE